MSEEDKPPIIRVKNELVVFGIENEMAAGNIPPDFPIHLTSLAIYRVSQARDKYEEEFRALQAGGLENVSKEDIERLQTETLRLDRLAKVSYELAQILEGIHPDQRTS